jgi:hypothetical protein
MGVAAGWKDVMILLEDLKFGLLLCFHTLIARPRHLTLPAQNLGQIHVLLLGPVCEENVQEILKEYLRSI